MSAFKKKKANQPKQVCKIDKNNFAKDVNTCLFSHYLQSVSNNIY